MLYESYDDKGNKFMIKSKTSTFDEKKLYYTNCGHSLCNECFLKIANINNKCPICRESLESKNKNIPNEITNICLNSIVPRLIKSK